MNKAGKCVHFNGVQNMQCKVGIAYGNGPLPCLPSLKIEGAPTCPKYREPTADEIAADKAEHDAHMAKFITVMAVVKDWRTWTKKNRVAKQEVIECPACKGRLHLSQAAYNGHVWGKCETVGCVNWME